MYEIESKLRTFLSKFFRNHHLDRNQDIFSLGFVNSLFAMQLVMFLENEFLIKISNEDLNISNFNTINKIIEFINLKQNKMVKI